MFLLLFQKGQENSVGEVLKPLPSWREGRKRVAARDAAAIVSAINGTGELPRSSKGRFKQPSHPQEVPSTPKESPKPSPIKPKASLPRRRTRGRRSLRDGENGLDDEWLTADSDSDLARAIELSKATAAAAAAAASAATITTTTTTTTIAESDSDPDTDSSTALKFSKAAAVNVDSTSANPTNNDKENDDNELARTTELGKGNIKEGEKSRRKRKQLPKSVKLHKALNVVNTVPTSNLSTPEDDNCDGKYDCDLAKAIELSKGKAKEEAKLRRNPRNEAKKAKHHKSPDFADILSDSDSEVASNTGNTDNDDDLAKAIELSKSFNSAKKSRRKTVYMPKKQRSNDAIAATFSEENESENCDENEDVTKSKEISKGPSKQMTKLSESTKPQAKTINIKKFFISKEKSSKEEKRRNAVSRIGDSPINEVSTKQTKEANGLEAPPALAKKLSKKDEKKKGSKQFPKLNLDRRNAKGETQLQRACIKGDVELVRDLLNRGASANVRDHAGWTPLHEAAQRGFVSIVEVRVYWFYSNSLNIVYAKLALLR